MSKNDSTAKQSKISTFWRAARLNSRRLYGRIGIRLSNSLSRCCVLPLLPLFSLRSLISAHRI